MNWNMKDRYFISIRMLFGDNVPLNIIHNSLLHNIYLGPFNFIDPDLPNYH